MQKAALPDSQAMIRKLRSIVDISDEDEAAILALPITVRQLSADQDIVAEGERPGSCCLVIEGFACRYKILPDGRRQIMAFHIPGDIPDLQSLHLKVMDHGLATTTPCRLAFITHHDMWGLCERRSAIAAAMWRETLIDSAVGREWMIGIGRRSARTRTAHLLCELFVRLQAVGLTRGREYDLPLTQTELGDALGLSVVAVNRVLQDLRAESIITLKSGTVTLLDWEALGAAGQFDPSYLHLKRPPEFGT